MLNLQNTSSGTPLVVFDLITGYDSLTKLTHKTNPHKDVWHILVIRINKDQLLNFRTLTITKEIVLFFTNIFQNCSPQTMLCFSIFILFLNLVLTQTLNGIWFLREFLMLCIYFLTTAVRNYHQLNGLKNLSHFYNTNLLCNSLEVGSVKWVLWA